MVSVEFGIWNLEFRVVGPFCRVFTSQPEKERETFVNGLELSTYVDAALDLGWLHFLHCVTFCNNLQRIEYRILYRVLRCIGSLCPAELPSICDECLRRRDAHVVKQKSVS